MTMHENDDDFLGKDAKNAKKRPYLGVNFTQPDNGCMKISNNVSLNEQWKLWKWSLSFFVSM